MSDRLAISLKRVRKTRWAERESNPHSQRRLIYSQRSSPHCSICPRWVRYLQFYGCEGQRGRFDVALGSGEALVNHRVLAARGELLDDRHDRPTDRGDGHRVLSVVGEAPDRERVDAYTRSRSESQILGGDESTVGEAPPLDGRSGRRDALQQDRRRPTGRSPKRSGHVWKEELHRWRARRGVTHRAVRAYHVDRDGDRSGGGRLEREFAVGEAPWRGCRAAERRPG